MTLRQCEIFLAVAREASFSLAARKIHLSQPTLSEHVAELERELRARLFLRHGRRITLTEAGRVFEKYATRIVATVADARQAVADLDGLARGSLLIGGSTTPGTYVLPGVIAAFRGRHPGIDVTLALGNSREIEERVRRNELDLGIVGGHVLGPGEQCLAAGLDDELVLIVPQRHPYARGGEVSGAQLAGRPLLMREGGSATRQVTERVLLQAGIPFKVGLELASTEAIKQAVLAGLGVAFVSVHAIRGELASRALRAVRIAGVPIRRHFHVIHDDERPLTASTRAFIALLDRREGAPPPVPRRAR